MLLRSGKAKTVIPWLGAEKRDLGDRIYMLAQEFDDLPTEVTDKYNPVSKNALKFDAKDASQWAKKINAFVQRKMLSN